MVSIEEQVVGVRHLAGTDYSDFIAGKTQLGPMSGINPVWIPDFLFDFQKALVEWALRKGKGAHFCDCGLGKTAMQLVWGENIYRHTNRNVLILAPLAVAPQTVREGSKFGIEVRRSLDGAALPGLTVTNYERLHLFDPDDFDGVVCDESSILKNFDGVRRAAITEFMRRVPYRLLCTATAAPNDYTELGTSAEAIGELGHRDMLSRFFTTAEQNGFRRRGGRVDGGWRFKGHAERPFWQWVCSWARAIRRPSDLGFDDGDFILPPIEERETVVQARQPRPGMLFDVPATGFLEEKEARRRTIPERCEEAASKVAGSNPAVIWCHLNDEGDLLARLVPDGVQVSGRDSDEAKEEKFEAFRNGQIRVMVIKPKIGAFGLNWQHCAKVVYFTSHSYEQYYQAVRRCWRFGQTRPVSVDLIRTDSEEKVSDNLRRKGRDADRMFSDLVAQMNEVLSVERSQRFERKMEVPTWL